MKAAFQMKSARVYFERDQEKAGLMKNVRRQAKLVEYMEGFPYKTREFRQQNIKSISPTG